MSGLEHEYAEASAHLQAAIARLIGSAEAADADVFGADVFRHLLSYARAVSLDLDGDLFRGPGADQALRRLSLLGAELSLHQWTEVWPAVTETALIQEAQLAAEALRTVVRARSAAADAN